MGVFSENAIIGASAAGDYDIDQSARITGGKLIRTPTSAGNRKTWTYSAWVKRSTLDNGSTTQGDSQTIFSAGPNSSNYFYLAFSSSVYSAGYQDSLYIDEYAGGQNIQKNTSQKFRDVGAWYHIVVAVDTTQATASNRIKVYVNGEQVTDWARDTNPPLNYDSQVNSTNFHGLGESSYGSGAGYWQYHGYLAEVHFVDGQALTPASFGETNSATNQWVPIEVTGMTYGTNGFYLPFSNTELNNFVDSSSSSHTITAVGDVTHSRVQKKIGNSSIYLDGTGDALTVADHSDFSFGSGQFTLEAFVRLDNTNRQVFISKHDELGNNREFKWEYESGNMVFGYSTNGSSNTWVNFSWTPSVDTWYHIAISRDSSSDLRAFVDGTQIGSTTAASATFYNSGAILSIGANIYNGSVFNSLLTGYLDEIRISNTARYTSNFTPSTTAFSSDANTKLLIHSDFDGGLGADYSGNFNDFSATNLVATDQVLDSPTNNFCTINYIHNDYSSSWTLSEGNLKFTASGDSVKKGTMLLPKSGKWYFEVEIDNNTIPYMGVVSDWIPLPSYNVQRGTFLYVNNGLNATYVGYDGGNLIGYSNTPTGSIIGIAHDSSTGETKYYRDNSLLRTVTTAFSSDDFTFFIAHGSSGGTGGLSVNFGQDSSFAGQKTAQGNTDGNGKGDFYYAPPSGYLALCEDNLSDPSIADPTAHFVSSAYSGNGSSQTINTVFAPDLAWVKRRDATSYHILTDTVRGAGNYLVSNVTDAESSGGSQLINAFTSSGFTVGTEAAVNNSSGTYVGWAWKAGGTASSNTDGTITSTVSANPTAGFSIVSYTGNGVDNSSIGHGLSQAPELIILKKRATSADGWPVYHKDLTSGYELFLNLTNAQADDVNNATWGDNHPGGITSSVFEVGYAGDSNGNTNTYIAYCFHSVEGYSKVGSYTGNGSTDGSFIYTGFSPAWVMIKRSSSAENWVIMDNKRNTYNWVGARLYPDLNNAEGNSETIDFVGNGFKMRSTNSITNAASTYVYLAIAESPFKTANAR